MTIDITTIIELIIALLGTIITVIVIPWIKTKLNNEQWNTLNEYAIVFVKDKKKWVIEKLTAIAEEHHLKFSADAIEAAIENAVKNMNDILEITDYKPEISE